MRGWRIYVCEAVGAGVIVIGVGCGRRIVRHGASVAELAVPMFTDVTESRAAE